MFKNERFYKYLMKMLGVMLQKNERKNQKDDRRCVKMKANAYFNSVNFFSAFSFHGLASLSFIWLTSR